MQMRYSKDDDEDGGGDDGNDVIYILLKKVNKIRISRMMEVVMR